MNCRNCRVLFLTYVIFLVKHTVQSQSQLGIGSNWRDQNTSVAISGVKTGPKSENRRIGLYPLRFEKWSLLCCTSSSNSHSHHSSLSEETKRKICRKYDSQHFCPEVMSQHERPEVTSVPETEYAHWNNYWQVGHKAPEDLSTHTHQHFHYGFESTTEAPVGWESPGEEQDTHMEGHRHKHMKPERHKHTEMEGHKHEVLKKSPFKDPIVVIALLGLITFTWVFTCVLFFQIASSTEGMRKPETEKHDTKEKTVESAVELIQHIHVHLKAEEKEEKPKHKEVHPKPVEEEVKEHWGSSESESEESHEKHSKKSKKKSKKSKKKSKKSKKKRRDLIDSASTALPTNRRPIRRRFSKTESETTDMLSTAKAINPKKIGSPLSNSSVGPDVQAQVQRLIDDYFEKHPEARNKQRSDLESKELAKEILGLTAESMHTAAYSILLVNVLLEILEDRLSTPEGGRLRLKSSSLLNLKNTNNATETFILKIKDALNSTITTHSVTNGTSPAVGT